MTGPHHCEGNTSRGVFSLEQLLRQRADKLAEKSSGSQHQQGQMTEIVVFTIQQELFGIELPYIYEVIDFPSLIPVYQVSHTLQGVFHYRGEIIPLFLLRAILGYPNNMYAPTGKCIVLGIDSVHFAISIDTIAQPRSIPKHTLAGQSSGPNFSKQKLVIGFFDDGITIIDGLSLLNDTSLIIDDQS